ncbi:hypothetical protein ID866_4070 [Astraeus odoratus]|nr:hypothetical protein ID866_4070 [Astraeus odoratus]
MALPNTSQRQRDHLKEIAESTIRVITAGKLACFNDPLDLAAKVKFSNRNTHYYPPNSSLSRWNSALGSSSALPHTATDFSIREMTTLQGGRMLCDILASKGRSYGRIALLSFASATEPGGAYVRGVQAQEESIARSSTLVPSLVADVAGQFYKHHRCHHKSGYYSHAMIYTPAVVVFRNDDGQWISPFEVDVLTCAAVNAHEVQKTLRMPVGTQPWKLEEKIEGEMRERMARILFLLEEQGAKNIVLGSFGAGAYGNNVETVARIWMELLVGTHARYRYSFERVVFAVLGKETYKIFTRAFNNRRTRM